jgi:hypothetical protein
METKLEAWTDKIQQWKDSGLSGAAWCRENDVVYSQFLYRKERVAQQTPESFVELRDPQSDESGIEIEIQGIVVRLAKDFDAQALLCCLKLLRTMAC